MKTNITGVHCQSGRRGRMSKIMRIELNPVEYKVLEAEFEVHVKRRCAEWVMDDTMTKEEANKRVEFLGCVPTKICIAKEANHED